MPPGIISSHCSPDAFEELGVGVFVPTASVFKRWQTTALEISTNDISQSECNW